MSRLEQAEEPALGSMAAPLAPRTTAAGAAVARFGALVRPDVVIGCLLFVGTLVVAYSVDRRILAQVAATGDEPWYLLLGYSIVHNHTVDVTAVLNNPRVYGMFLGSVPVDHVGDPLHNGVNVLQYLPGYAALAGLFYAWHGRPAVLLMQAAFASLTATLLYVEAVRVFRSRLAGIFAALGVICIAPALLYIGQDFPSTVAASFVFLGFAAVAHWVPAARGRLLAAAVAAFAGAALVLPWLHFRYMLVSLAVFALGAAALYRRYAAAGNRRSAVASVLGVAALAALNLGIIALYCRHYFGTLTPPADVARNSAFGTLQLNVPRGLALFYVVFLNPQAGLLPWAPLLFLAPVGMLILWRCDRWTAVCLASLFVGLMGILASAFVSDMVYQGYAFPARFAIESIPLLSLATAGVFAWAIGRATHQSILPVAARRQSGRTSWSQAGEATATPESPAAGRGSERAAGTYGRLWGAVLAIVCVVLLGGGAVFGIVASSDAHLLYYSPAGLRLAYKFPHLLPLWWFQSFPDTEESFWSPPPINASDIALANTTVVNHGSQSALTSDTLQIAPGRYVAHYRFTCASSSPRAATTASSPVDVTVLRITEASGPIRIAQATVSDPHCGSPPQPALASLNFVSNGYEQIVFVVTFSPDMHVVDATAAFAHH